MLIDKNCSKYQMIQKELKIDSAAIREIIREELRD